MDARIESGAAASVRSAAPSAAPPGARFALDPASLNELKRKSRDGGGEAQGKALRQAAGQFEAVFMNMLLKSMRESLPKEGVLDSESTRSFTGMYDMQIAQKLADKGVGLADMIVRQVEARSGPQPVAAGRSPGTSSGAPEGVLPAAGQGAGRNTVISTVDKLKALTTEAQRAGRAMSAGAASASASSTEIRGSAKGAAAGAPQEFVQRMWESAKSAEQSTGMPAQFILGQAALESGWGRREIRHADGGSSHNLFGIKAGAGWGGPTVKAVTTEFVNGVARKSTETFRAYASYADSFADYARLINNNPRYAAARNAGADASVFARSLQTAGYATDPLYAAKLTRVIEQTVRATA